MKVNSDCISLGKVRLLSVAILWALMVSETKAQEIGLKNNLLYDASLTPNANVEFGLSPKWSTDIGFGIHPWTLDGDKKLRHWLLQPEARRWFCQRFNGSFLAFHLMGGEFNAGNVKLPFGIAKTLRDNRYEGWFAGAGIGYGYQWPVSRHFSIEAEVAVGYDYIHYRQYPCATCGTMKDKGNYHYFGPTKIALNLVYNINKGVSPTASHATELDYSLISTGRQIDGAYVALLGGSAKVSQTSVAAVGSNMVLSMNVNLDDLRLRHGQTVVLRPVLRSADGQQVARFRPLLIDSRDQHVMHERGIHNEKYPDAIEVRRRNGMTQTVGYLAQVPQETWMNAYQLEIEEDLCGCGDPVADNVTPLLAYDPQPTAAPAIEIALSPDDYKKERQIEGQAYIDFRVNKTNLDPQYRRNPQELKKIIATIDEVRGKTDVEINSVSIHGYASPEGSYDNNVRLAKGRAATLAEYIRQLYSFSSDVISSTYTPEDWDGLRRYVASHNELAEQQDLLSIIDGTLEPDPKNEAIKRQFPQRYQQLLNEVYPALRHSDYVITYAIRPYTLAESREVYQHHPQDLSLSELTALAADAGLQTSEGRAILYRAAELLPQNPCAQMLAAQAALQVEDYGKAEALLAPLADSPQRNYLLGAVRKMQKRYDEALALMQQAKTGGIAEAQAQLDEIQSLKGK